MTAKEIPKPVTPRKPTTPVEHIKRVAMMDFTGDVPDIDSINEEIFRRMSEAKNIEVIGRDIIQNKIIETELLDIERLPEMLNADMVIFGTINKEGSGYNVGSGILDREGNIDMQESTQSNTSGVIIEIMNKVNSNLIK